jgi:hypothetical protein
MLHPVVAVASILAIVAHYWDQNASFEEGLLFDGRPELFLMHNNLPGFVKLSIFPWISSNLKLILLQSTTTTAIQQKYSPSQHDNSFRNVAHGVLSKEECAALREIMDQKSLERNDHFFDWVETFPIPHLLEMDDTKQILQPVLQRIQTHS